MGRGRSSSGGSSRGSSSSGSRGFSSSSRGRSNSRRFSSGRWNNSPSRTTVIIGGHHNNRNYGGGKSEVGVLVFMAVIFMLFGLVPFAMGVGIVVKANRYETVQAVCVDNNYSGGWYYTTYEYEVKGIDYKNESSVGWEFPETKGKTVTIYYLKSNPNQITEEAPTSAGKGVAIMLFSLVFVGAGVLLICAAVKQRKQGKINVGEKSSETEVPAFEEETEIKCPYCGSKYDKKLSACPRCGASKK